jgi:protein transport protein SEC20
MTNQSTLDTLSRLSDNIKLTFQLISRLSKLSFQPGSTPLQGDGDVRIELAHDIRDALKHHDDTLDTLRQEIEDVTEFGAYSQRRRDSLKDRERARIAAQLARLDEDLKQYVHLPGQCPVCQHCTHPLSSARSQFRAAQLSSKRASEAAKQKEREILFSSIQQPLEPDSTSSTPDPYASRRPQPKQLTQDELLINASTDVTSALRRTHNLLTSELSRSRFAQETLDQSTAALADLGERYTDLDSLLSNSKNLLGTLVRSQKSDTWYLETAFYLLVTTICWLVFRRLIYGPAWWFVWLPFKFFLLKPVFLVFSLLGITGGSSATAAVSSVSSVVSVPPTIRIQPSASALGDRPTFRRGMDQRPANVVPVGGGGAKADYNGRPQDPSPDGSMSQSIGKMAEASREQVAPQEEELQESQAPQEAPEPKQPQRRGDGTILQERGDIPRNPKKKMWEEEVEAPKHQMRKRDEL